MTVVDKCPLCGGEKLRRFERSHAGEQEITYLICVSCSLVFQSPRMEEESLQQYYEAQYRRNTQGVEGPSEKDVRAQLARARHMLPMLDGVVSEVGRYLDIGSSSGALIAMVRERYGCESAGVEPGAAYRAFAKAKGMAIYPDLEALSGSGEGRFDLISMSHVLEHIPDPVEYLMRVRREYLHPDGYLLIEVPNLYRHASLEPTHLIAFSADTLDETLSKAGFKVVCRRIHGGFRSTFLRLYVTVIARPSRSVQLHKVRRRSASIVRIRRSLGMALLWVSTKVASSLAWREPDPKDALWPGADDLAAGLCALLSLGAAFALAGGLEWAV